MSTESHEESAKPRPARGPHLRELLVHHATAILEEAGLEGLNLRRLAARIGITQPALYRHFESKDALLVEIITRGFGSLADAQRDALLGVDDAYEVLRGVGRSYVRYAAAHPGWFRLAFSRAHGPRLLAGAAPTPQHLAARARLLRAMACVVGVDDPAFGPTFRLVWGLAHGLASLVTERVFQLVSDDDARIAAADASIDELIASLRARWGPARPLDSLPASIDADAAQALIP